VLALEEAVGLADAEELGPRAYLTTPELRRVLKQTERAAGAGYVWERDEVNGYPAFASRHVPSNLTKGIDTNLHAILFGVWSELMLCTAGVAEIVVDGVTRAKRGLVEVIVYSYGDIGLRHPQAFAVIKDAKLS
ncbi:MAG TPA: phage major capsid protein, partial [Vicinamibacterales bacterium]